MKTNFIAQSLLILGLSSLISTQSMAQRPSNEKKQGGRAEMVEARAEKMAQDLELKGDEKEKFVSSFKAYQNELADVQRGNRDGRKVQGMKSETDKKKLSDEEATQSVEEYFARQEQQIAQQQKRLEVETKYYETWKETLTPQQLAKIFRQQQRRAGMPGNGQQRPGGFGGQQGGGRGPRGGFGGASQGGDMEE